MRIGGHIDRLIQSDWKGHLSFEPFPFVLEPRALGKDVGYVDRASARFSYWSAFAYFFVLPLAFGAFMGFLIELTGSPGPAALAVFGGAAIALTALGVAMIRVRGRERMSSRLLLFDGAKGDLSIMLIDSRGTVQSKMTLPVASCELLTHEVAMYSYRRNGPFSFLPFPHGGNRWGIYLGKGHALLVWVGGSFFAIAAVKRPEDLARVPIPDWLKLAKRGHGQPLEVGADRRLGQKLH